MSERQVIPAQPGFELATFIVDEEGPLVSYSTIVAWEVGGRWHGARGDKRRHDVAPIALDSDAIGSEWWAIKTPGKFEFPEYPDQCENEASALKFVERCAEQERERGVA
jgi:hypothetical protein